MCSGAQWRPRRVPELPFRSASAHYLQDRRRAVRGDARLRAKGVELTSAEVLRGRGGQRVFLAVHELGKGVRGPRGLDVEHKVGPDRLGAVQDLTT